ncbi:MAG: DUF2089 domain-containing protein [Proteobacteria bacterium]|nr:DUF2089 domain-containing protein [Pseudomonadota bacterium]
MNKILDSCPVCSGKMIVSELECPSCRTKVVSQFDTEGGTLDVDKDILDFIKIFIYSEGSIKQSEKLLNCSYPKIKNLLKKAKAALGITEDYADSRANVIDRLDKGEISVEDALNNLKKVR